MKEGKESFSYALTGSSWQGEAGGGLTRSRHLMRLSGEGTHLAFSDLPSLGRRDKNRDSRKHCPHPQHSGLTLQRFMGGVLSSPTVWPLPFLYCPSLSSILAESLLLYSLPLVANDR